MEDRHSFRISALVVRILSKFKTLVSALADDQTQTSTATSHQARFKLWAGSLGAHRPSGYRSLEYRLRDASFIRNHVASLLRDLSNSINDGILVATGEGSPISQESSLDAVAMELDEYFESDEVSEPSEPGRILSGIGHTINCLLRLSIAIRNPAPYDQFRSRAGAEVAYYQTWDIQHVRDKFPDVNEKTAERVGKAMTQRRMYFRYREDHSGRLAQGLDSDVDVGGDEATTVASPIPDHLIDSASEQSPINGMTGFDDALSDSSGTSFAPSSSGQDKLLEPPIPKGYSEGPVKCPFCQMIIHIETLSAWRKHVFRDLRPYVCLVDDCLTPNHLYLRRREWIKHMELDHWRIWTCTLGCASGLFPTVSDLRNHLHTAHGQIITMTNIETLAGLNSRLDSAKARGSCPLCLSYCTETSADYARHVGHHLEQLARFTISNVTYDHDADEEGDEKGGELKDELEDELEDEVGDEQEDEQGVGQDTVLVDDDKPGDPGTIHRVEGDDTSPSKPDGNAQQPVRQNEYFIHRDGIDREVIAADICRYLGNDARARPGTYEDPDGRVTQGYFITAHRKLTTAMIQDLKADSVRWYQERRAAAREDPNCPPTSYDSARSSRWDDEGSRLNGFPPYADTNLNSSPQPAISKFTIEKRLNMPRIANDVWDMYKTTILEEYKTLTLDGVRAVMEKEHNFIASRRQYVHALNRWGVTKYRTKYATPIKFPRDTPVPDAKKSDSAEATADASDFSKDAGSTAAQFESGSTGIARDSLRLMPDASSVGSQGPGIA